MSKKDTKKQEITRLVIQTKAMRLTPPEAVEHIKEHGYKIALRTFYKYKKKVVSHTWNRAEEIAKGGLLDQHMQRIDNLETIEAEQWICYNKSSNPSQQSAILERIANLQPYITAMYDSTRVILEKQIQMKKEFVIGEVVLKH